MSTRPRGFIEAWNPKPQTEILIGNVQQILQDNHDILPLTLRQIFYMLVTGYAYDKTERSYKRLCETMNKARRARWVSMDKIRDDGLREEKPHYWAGEDELIEAFKGSANRFRLDRQRGQYTHVMVWCEAGGMLPQLAHYCEDWSVPVLSSGGFDSVTTKHNFAREVSYIDAPQVEILHIGDHDPSGVHMCSSLDEDLQAFVQFYGGDICVTRLAVTPDQMDELALPTAPPKKTDNRSFEGRTTQAEAIPPRVLKDIVTDAIEWRVDTEARNSVLEEEEVTRAALLDRLAGL